ncbi:MAG: 4'-phosphopantetheinyl transferase superfamily protein [Oligoflexales bacterium]
MIDGGHRVLSVGNDVVDIRRTERHHPRFAHRVLSAWELDTFASKGKTDPLLLWKMWAAKEAAYKDLKRYHQALVFSPRRFEIDFDNGTARSQDTGEALAIQTFTGDNWVYCTANSTKGVKIVSYLSDVSQIKKFGDIDNDSKLSKLSQQVRILARAAAAKEFSLPLDKIEIKTSPTSKAPSLRLGDNKDLLPLSLSHHGDYLAAAWAVPNATFSSIICSL